MYIFIVICFLVVRCIYGFFFFFFYLDDGCGGTNYSYSNNFTQSACNCLHRRKGNRKLFTVGSVGELIAKTELSVQDLGKVGFIFAHSQEFTHFRVQ